MVQDKGDSEGLKKKPEPARDAEERDAATSAVVDVLGETSSEREGLASEILGDREGMEERVVDKFSSIEKVWEKLVEAIKNAFAALGLDFDESDILAHTDTRDDEPEIENYEPTQEVEKKERPREIFSSPERSGLDGYITEASDKYDVPATLITTVIRMESGFNPTVCNGTHCGLGQLGKPERIAFTSSSDCPDNIRENFDWKNPKHNIFATAWLLRAKRAEVNKLIDQDSGNGWQKGYKEGYRIAPNGFDNLTGEDAKMWWRSYHDGAGGYLKWRRWQDDQSEVNWKRLSYFQKDLVWLERTRKYSDKVGAKFEAYKTA
ncbi:MAG: transglycosylase SLT domain-containing protein [Patescibacteria group bacterium]